MTTDATGNTQAATGNMQVPPSESTPGDGDVSIRWWPLGLIVGIFATLWVLIWYGLDFPRGYQVMASMAWMAAFFFWVVVWLAFFANLRGTVHILAVTIPLGIALILGMTFRVDTFDGDMVPTFAYRWSPKPHQTLSVEPSRAIEPAEDAPGLVTSEYDFPQFLGPDRNGEITTPPLARDWAKQPPELLWKRPIGGGWSGFAIVGNHAYTQEQRGDLELVTCYELHTGESVWSHQDVERFFSVVGGDGPRATPTVQDGRVYAMGAKGLLSCLDARTGDIFWQHQVRSSWNAEVAKWGMACSPLVVDNLVIVRGGAEFGPSVMAFDIESGERVWTGGAEGKVADSYSSPLLCTFAGREQVLVLDDDGVAAYAPGSGETLWTFPFEGGNPKVPQPVPLPGDNLLITCGYSMGCVVVHIEQDKDGEFSAFEVWEKNLNLKSKFSNVEVIGQYAYGLDAGIMVCLDLKDGSRKWKRGRYGHGQLLLLNQNLLLVQAEDGRVLLVDPSPDGLKELTSMQALDGKIWNPPAMSGNLLLVRNDREAALYELPLASTEATAAAAE